MTASGWYQAEGDPPGTTRYWDGSQWVGEPVYTPVASTPGGFSAPGMQPGQGPQLASPGSRIGARLLDTLVILIIAAALFAPAISGVISDIGDLGPSPTDSEVQDIITDAVEDNVGRLAVLSIGGILWDFLWVAFLGGTPGKLMLKLRVARADTGATPPGFGKAALRSLNRLVSLIPGFGSLINLLVGLVSLIMLFSDDQHRTVMDRVASTVVIKK